MKHIALLLTFLSSPLAMGAKPLPPFPENAAESFCSYVEWVLNAPLTEKQRQEAAAHLKRILVQKDAFEAEIIRDAVLAYDDLSNHTEAEKLNFRNSVEDELFKILKSRFRTKPLAKWLGELNEKTHQVVAEGPPVFSQQAAEAWEELIQFLWLESAGHSLDTATFEEAQSHLAEDFQKLSEEQKRILADAPSAWAALRQSWKKKSDEEKQKLREVWKTALSPASPSDAGTNDFRAQTQSLLTSISGWL